MTDAADGRVGTASSGQPTAEQAALAAEAAARGGSAPAPAAAVPLSTTTDERPELLVGAAFAGGLTLALLLKRLAR